MRHAHVWCSNRRNHGDVQKALLASPIHGKATTKADQAVILVNGHRNTSAARGA